MSNSSDPKENPLTNFVRALARRAARLDDEAWERVQKSMTGWKTEEPPTGVEVEFWRDGKDLDCGVLISAGQGEVKSRRQPAGESSIRLFQKEGGGEALFEVPRWRKAQP